LKDSPLNVFSAKFSPDGNFIAASYANGLVSVHTTVRMGVRSERVYNPKIAERKVDALDPRTPRGGDPFVKPIITSISWRPVDKDSAYQNFKAVTSDGRILNWKPENSYELETLMTSETNYYHSIDYSPDFGSKFVCAGKLPFIEIYDDATEQKIKFVDEDDHVGHINKIFCCKFD
jgi:WD40 repeat protein